MEQGQSLTVEETLLQVRHIRFEPGDVLAVLVPRAINAEQALRIREGFEGFVPETVKVVVLADGADVARVSFGHAPRAMSELAAEMFGRFATERVEEAIDD